MGNFISYIVSNDALWNSSGDLTYSNDINIENKQKGGKKTNLTIF